MENGLSVAFFRLEELLLALKRDAELPPSRLRRRKYNNVALVIVDEVGFEVMSREGGELVLPPGQLLLRAWQRPDHDQQWHPYWPEVLAVDEILTTAILDRLLHHSLVLNIKGRSYRLRDLERAAERTE